MVSSGPPITQRAEMAAKATRKTAVAALTGRLRGVQAAVTAESAPPTSGSRIWRGSAEGRGGDMAGAGLHAAPALPHGANPATPLRRVAIRNSDDMLRRRCLFGCLRTTYLRIPKSHKFAAFKSMAAA